MVFETGLHTESSGAEVSVLEDLFDTSFPGRLLWSCGLFLIVLAREALSLRGLPAPGLAASNLEGTILGREW